MLMASELFLLYFIALDPPSMYKTLKGQAPSDLAGDTDVWCSLDMIKELTAVQFCFLYRRLCLSCSDSC